MKNLKSVHNTLDDEVDKVSKQQREKTVKYDIYNSVFANENENFKLCCEKAGVKPTKRQASKFRNKSGAAYKFMKENQG